MSNKVVAFDLDGTLIDSAPDIRDALNYVLKKKKLKIFNLSDIRPLIGGGAKALIQRAFLNQNKPIDDIESCLKIFLRAYKKCFKNKTKLFPFAKHTLKKLYNLEYKIILVSNKPEFFCRALLKHLDIDKYFLFISGGDTFRFKKPSSKHLKLACKMAGISNFDCVLVGDSEIDAGCAQNLNIPLILMKHGYCNYDLDALGAAIILDSFKNFDNHISKLI